MYEALNWITDCSELDHNEPNHGQHCQIIMWDPCSCEILHSVEW